MYKVALHIGLPKTATTSLQNNLLYPAHMEGKINYLGRYGEPTGSDYYNPFECVFSKLSKKDLSSSDIIKLQDTLFSFMEKGKLNVISEEVLSSTYKFEYLRLENLRKILEPCDVKLLVSLRQPLDFMLSYYAECYRWKFHSDEKINTIDKFADQLLGSIHNKEYDILKFEAFLSQVSRMFPNIQVLLFEDIKYDRAYFCEILASFFQFNCGYVERLFYEKELNTRKASMNGRVSEGVTLSQKLSKMVQVAVSDSLKNKLKKMAFVNSLYTYLLKALKGVTVEKGVHHIFSNPLKKNEVESYLLLNESFAAKYNLETNKLESYGYVIKLKGKIRNEF